MPCSDTRLKLFWYGLSVVAFGLVVAGMGELALSVFDGQAAPVNLYYALLGGWLLATGLMLLRLCVQVLERRSRMVQRGWE